MSLHNVVLQVVPEETDSEHDFITFYLNAPKIKLIGKLLLLGLKSGTTFYIESEPYYLKKWYGLGRVCHQ